MTGLNPRLQRSTKHVRAIIVKFFGVILVGSIGGALWIGCAPNAIADTKKHAGEAPRDGEARHRADRELHGSIAPLAFGRSSEANLLIFFALVLVSLCGSWCHSRRKKAVGGWLLLYLMLLYLKVFHVLLGVAGHTSDWDYAIAYLEYAAGFHYELAVVVLDVLWLIEGAISVNLLRQKSRGWAVVRALRLILLAKFVLALATVTLHSAFIDGTLWFEPRLALGFSAVWTLYFFLSKRIRSVYLTKDWDVSAAIDRPVTAER